jgi:hypothetical protein
MMEQKIRRLNKGSRFGFLHTKPARTAEKWVKQTQPASPHNELDGRAERNLEVAKETFDLRGRRIAHLNSA